MALWVEIFSDQSIFLSVDLFFHKISILHVSQQKMKILKHENQNLSTYFSFTPSYVVRHLTLVLHDLGKKIKHLKYIILGKRGALQFADHHDSNNWIFSLIRYSTAFFRCNKFITKVSYFRDSTAETSAKVIQAPNQSL